MKEVNNIDKMKLSEIKKIETRLFDLIDTLHSIGVNYKREHRERLIKEIESVTLNYSHICL